MKEEKFDFYSKTSLKSYNLDEAMRYQLSMLDSLDVFTRAHSENVANLTCRICEYMNASNKFTVYCTICAYLHDIGKLFIPSKFLQKNGPLTDEEYKIMKNHTTIGHKICMNDLKLRPYAAGAIYHHEALNGTGYPNGLTKKDIPYEGQIIRVADEYDAIVSKRQYKSHIGIVDTLKILIDETKPIKKSDALKAIVSDTKPSHNPHGAVKDHSFGKNNPIVVKALLKVVIDDTEYEISCIMDYLKQLKPYIERLELVEKYNKKRLEAKNEKKHNYYLEGMKALLIKDETLDNYAEILNSYRNIVETKNIHIKQLFEEIKIIKKLKV